MGFLRKLFGGGSNDSKGTTKRMGATLYIKGTGTDVVSLVKNRYIIGLATAEEERVVGIGRAKLIGIKIVIGRSSFTSGINDRHCALTWNSRNEQYDLLVFVDPDQKRKRLAPTILVKKNRLATSGFEAKEGQVHGLFDGEYMFIPEMADHPLEIRIRY